MDLTDKEKITEEGPRSFAHFFEQLADGDAPTANDERLLRGTVAAKGTQ